MARRTKRLWTDEEKRSICLQTTARDVSVAQVARRYSMNANLIFTWLRDPRYAVPAPYRPLRAEVARRAPGARQLRHPQDARGDGLAGDAPALPPAFHADQRVMAEHGRTVPRRDHVTAHPARQLRQRRRARGRHLRLPPPAQHQPEALHLDQIGRGHPRQRAPRPERPR